MDRTVTGSVSHVRSAAGLYAALWRDALTDMGAQAMTTDDDNRRRKIRTNAIVLGLVAFAVFIGFIMLMGLRG